MRMSQGFFWLVMLRAGATIGRPWLDVYIGRALIICVVNSIYVDVLGLRSSSD